MGNIIQISVGNRTVGSLELTDSGTELAARGIRPTADGFVMTLPARISLDWQEENWQPLVSNLRAFVFVDDGSGMELGIAHDTNFYFPNNPRLENKEVALEWRGSLEALHMLEKRRNGAPPKLWLRCSGEASPVFYAGADRNTRPLIRGVPERIYGEASVCYPQDVWVKLMQNIGAIGNILIEMPVRTNFPSDWREIYSALVEAKGNLARGGTDGWKGCVAAVRLALEKWQEIEPADQGPGWKSPTRDEREDRTKAQRAAAMRWHLLQFAHLSHHSPADGWTRDDGILAVTALAALLAERNP